MRLAAALRAAAAGARATRRPGLRRPNDGSGPTGHEVVATGRPGRNRQHEGVTVVTRNDIGAMASIGLACALWIAPALAAAPWLPELIEHAVTAGVDAKLPPVLSVVLGVASREQATPVRQIVVRAESKVRTFNVSASDHSKVVLLWVDEQAQATMAFLVSPKGNLRKAVAYTAGSPAEVLSNETARPALARELEYWSHQPRK
jgi:hypothetical protein